MSTPRQAPGTGALPGRVTRVLLGDDREDVARGEDEVLLAGVLDLGAAVLAVDDLVTDSDVERNAVAVVVDATGTDRQDLALLGLLLGGVRDDETGGRGLLGLHGLDDDAVFERLDGNRHGGTSPSGQSRCGHGGETSGATARTRRRRGDRRARWHG